MKLLFLGLNDNQIPYIQELKKMGFYIIGTDKNNKAKGIKYIDKFYQCGYDEFDKLVKIGIEESFSSNDKVFTASSQFSHLGASYFAKYFNIKYPKFENIKLCLDKSLYYNYFTKYNIPLPKTWYIKTKQELNEILSYYSENKKFYLKSDNSKNPNYVYNFKNIDYKKIDINWKKDRYFQKYYILQEEFFGEHIRVNIFGNKLSIYHFEIEKLNADKSKQIELIKNSNVLKVLQDLISNLEMLNWLLKFDIVINDKGFVVLDIGIDPPYRMRKDYENKNKNFVKSYCEMYILEKNSFEMYDWSLK